MPVSGRKGSEELGQGGLASPDACTWSSKLHNMQRLETLPVPISSILHWPAVILGKLLTWFLAGMKIIGLGIALQNWEAPDRIRTALK